MAGTDSDGGVVYCGFCEVEPADGDLELCDVCKSQVFPLMGLVIRATVRRLLPEFCIGLMVVALSQIVSGWLLWGLVPLGIAAGVRGFRVFMEEGRKVVFDYHWDRVPALELEAYLAGWREGYEAGVAKRRAGIRAEAHRQGIVLSADLDAVLRGELDWDQLSAADALAIRPAVAAYDRRWRQLQEAYGIKADLPYGSAPVC